MSFLSGQDHEAEIEKIDLAAISSQKVEQGVMKRKLVGGEDTQASKKPKVVEKSNKVEDSSESDESEESGLSDVSSESEDSSESSSESSAPKKKKGLDDDFFA